MAPDREASVILDERRRWRNRHENVQQNIEGIYLLSNARSDDIFADYNDMTAEVQRLMRRVQRNGSRIRALGSGWSFTRVGVTDGFLLNNKQLNIALPIEPASVSPQYLGNVEHLLCFQSGISISQINRYLRGRNLSLKTSGASNGQTIAGAVSTGTHGAALDFGAMQDFVVGIHLATGPNRHVWLERTSYPVVSPGFVNRIGAELIQDDDMFNAALVGFGSFGVILSLLVETEDLFLLEAHRNRVPLNGDLKEALNSLDFANIDMPRPGQRPRHFGVVVNPHDLNGGALVTAMYERPYRDNYPRPQTEGDGLTLGDDFLSFLSRVLDLFPQFVTDAAIPGIVNAVIEDRYEEFSNQLGTHGEIFTATTTRGKLASTAIAVPVGRTAETLDLVLDIHEQEGPIPGAIGLRFVKGSRGVLAFTRFAQTCVLEIDGIDGDLIQSFYRKVWKAMRQSDILHAYHWGKMNGLTAAAVRRIYGDDVNTWVRAREALMTPGMREVFSNPFLRKVGLAT